MSKVELPVIFPILKPVVPVAVKVPFVTEISETAFLYNLNSFTVVEEIV